MNCLEEIEVLKKIDIKKVFFNVIEKGDVEELKNIMDNLGHDILKKALCVEVESPYGIKNFIKTTNEEGLNIFEVLVEKSVSIEMFKFLLSKIKKTYSHDPMNDYKLEKVYENWFFSNNNKNFLLDRIIKKENVDYLKEMIKQSFIIKTDIFTKSLLTKKEMFEISMNAYGFHERYTEDVCNFLIENKENLNLKENFLLLKKEKENEIIPSLVFYVIKNKKETIYSFFKGIDICALTHKKENFFEYLKTEDEQICNFIKNAEIDIEKKNKQGISIVDLFNSSSNNQNFPYFKALLEKNHLQKNIKSIAGENKKNRL